MTMEKDDSRLEWTTPKLVFLAHAAEARNNIFSGGDIDATYAGFPNGYS